MSPRSRPSLDRPYFESLGRELIAVLAGYLDHRQAGPKSRRSCTSSIVDTGEHRRFPEERVTPSARRWSGTCAPAAVAALTWRPRYRCAGRHRAGVPVDAFGEPSAPGRPVWRELVVHRVPSIDPFRPRHTPGGVEQTTPGNFRYGRFRFRRRPARRRILTSEFQPGSACCAQAIRTPQAGAAETREPDEVRLLDERSPPCPRIPGDVQHRGAPISPSRGRHLTPDSGASPPTV